MLSVAMAVLVVVAGATAAGAQPALAANGPPAGYVPANLRVVGAVKAYSATHALSPDYVALNAAIVNAGGSPVRFDFPELGLHGLSPESAQVASQTRAANSTGDADATKTGPTASASPNATALAVDSAQAPVVGGYWSHVSDQYGEWWTYFGSWDFDNSYSTPFKNNGGPPDDAFGLASRFVSPSCWLKDGSDAWTIHATYPGEPTPPATPNSDNVSRFSAEFDETLWKVTDFIDDPLDTGLVPVVDRGFGYMSYKANVPCAPAYIYGRTFYEHNIGGGNDPWTFSLGWGALTINYSGDTPDQVKAASTDLIGIWTNDYSPCLCSPIGGGSDGPVARASVSLMQAATNVAITFNAGNSSGSGLSYSWNFGDGATATGQLAHHSYTNPGTYPVVLVVTDAQGRRSSTSVSIVVSLDRPVSAIVSPSGVVDVFWKATDSSLGHKWFTGGSWYGPESLGGAPLGSRPVAVTTTPGAIEVLWKGTDANLYHKAFAGGAWGPVQNLGAGPLGGDPVAVGQSNGIVDVFWKGTNGALWHKWLSYGYWYGPENLGGAPMGSDPVAVASAPGVIEVLWKGTDANLYHKAFAGGAWGPVQNLGAGPLGGNPVAVGQSNGIVDVFWKGTNGALWHKWLSYGYWYGPENLGGAPMGSDPVAVTSAPGVIEVLWKGTDGNLYHKAFAGGAWGPVQNLGAGPLGSAPTATGQANGIVDVFWKGTNGALWHKWLSYGYWYGPENLGGSIT
jgi:PKD repeat protein